MDIEILHAVLPPLGGLCFAVAGWMLVLFIISHLGWRPFVERYANLNRPPARFFTAGRASFGHFFDSYRNVVRVAFAPEGVYVRSTFPFNFSHAQFLVPWRCLYRAEVDRVLVFRAFSVEFRDDDRRLDMTLPIQAQADFEAARKESVEHMIIGVSVKPLHV